MANFISELKRRHIYRVAAAYAVVAWLLLQIVNNIIPIMQATAWTGQFCLLLLALGFPIALFFAWMRELPSAAAPFAHKATTVDLALIGVLVAVLVAVSYQELAPPRVISSQQAGVETARAAAAAPAGISIAVLPFTNLSSDKEQEFFSDGITEEITSALAKVPDLHVVGRTSAFQFKGQNQDLRSIGQSLSATHLIEGSVRKAGGRVRITVQLIKANDGTHIWTEDYDRQLTDIFVIQEDAAERAIRLDPNLADGYVALGRSQARRGKYLAAEEFLSKALALDPNNPDALAQYSNMLSFRPGTPEGSPRDE
jgi:TolB-like protein